MSRSPGGTRLQELEQRFEALGEQLEDSPVRKALARARG